MGRFIKSMYHFKTDFAKKEFLHVSFAGEPRIFDPDVIDIDDFIKDACDINAAKRMSRFLDDVFFGTRGRAPTADESAHMRQAWVDGSTDVPLSFVEIVNAAEPLEAKAN